MKSVETKQLTKALECKQQNRERRLVRYKELLTRLDGGMNRSEAARHMGLPLRTVQRWLSYGAFPERKHRVYPSIVNAYGSYLEKRYREGCRKVAQLWQEVKTMGFEGQATAVRHWLRLRFGSPKNASTQAFARRPLPVSPQRVAWLMLKADLTRHRYLKKLYQSSPEIALLGAAARKLFEMIRKRNPADWTQWLELAESSPLASFARRLQRDQKAVLAALNLPWSNGPVEGQIHRLKLLKRQMYGRAGFDLLKLRVLHGT